MMRHRILLPLFASLLLAFQGASTAHAQDQPIKKELDDAVRELKSLQRILAAFNRSDSLYTSYFPVWTVLDRNMRFGVQRAFQARGRSIPENAKVEVIASPDNKSIADIRVGGVSYGRLNAQALLDPDLTQRLLRKGYPYIDETPDGYKSAAADDRRSELVQREQTVAINLSLFGGRVQFTPHWAFVGKVGDDELGYPFWSSGQVWLLGSYKSIKLGAWLPQHGGLVKGDARQPLALQPRLLNGSAGVAGEFEFAWDAVRLQSLGFSYGAIGGRFAAGGLGNRRPELLTSDLDHLYSISTIVQGYYASHCVFDEQRQALNLDVGLSFHRVTWSKIESGSIANAGPPRDFVDPLVTVEYKNRRVDWFTLSAHYAHRMMLTAWAELLPPYIYAEVKYSSVLFRKADTWETPSSIYATIGFSIAF